MGFIKNYKKEQFAQINLGDGKRILVSFGRTDIKVFQLGFLNLPQKTLHTFSKQFTANLTRYAGYDLSKDPVKLIADALSESENVEELLDLIEKLENSKDVDDWITT